jgi:hypothetical protein
MRNGEAKAMSSTMRWTLGSILALGLAAGYGCGGDDTGDDDDTNTETVTPPAMGGGTVKNEIQISPAVAYSGFDGEHTFKVPLKVRFGPAGDWKCQPADACEFEPFEGGIMVTIRKAGDITVTAKTGEQNGIAKIVATKYEPSDWSLGQMRYNNGMGALRGADGATLTPEQAAAMAGVGGGTVNVMGIMVDRNAACTNCHGETGRLRIRHTPVQTAKYSDQELIDIFTMAKKPDGAGTRLVPADIYKLFHTWDLKESDRVGLVAYLRSLEPKEMEMLMFPGSGGGLDAGAP